MSLIDLEMAQYIFNKKVEQLLSDPLLAPFKDRLKPLVNQQNKPVRVTTYPFGPSKRTARSDMLQWLKQELGEGKHVASVYDLAGPGAAQLTDLWISDLRQAQLFNYQVSKITLIDRDSTNTALVSPHQYLREVLTGDIWDLLPRILKGKGTRGNSIISLDFCGTLHGAQDGDNANPDCAHVLPQLINNATADYNSLCIYLTVAVRGEGGIERLKTEMEQLGKLMSTHRWTCTAQLTQHYNDTHPMMSGMYLMRKTNP